MKTFFLTLTLAASMLACKTGDKKAEAAKLTEEDLVSKQEALNKQLADSANFTSLQWIDSTSQELGTVKEGKVVEVTYKFKNTGSKPLVIASVSASCGCTVPEKPEQPIMPGEEGVIKATFDSKDRVGTANKSVYVTANTSPSTSHELKFHVEVIK